jgi:Na+/H+ antiporter NhaD/arsenite permease-like protein
VSDINVVSRLSLSSVFRAVVRFIKRETVLTIALSLAVISAFFVPPSIAYIDYIDFKVLACLFCLMSVVAGLRRTGLFDRAALALTRYTTSVRGMAFILVGTTFFVSMAITNDVALITFIPFSLLLMKGVKNAKTRMKIITLQTIAANIGSSLTPVGNPQNLFIFSFYRMNAAAFFPAIGPIVLIGGAGLAVAIATIPDEKLPAIRSGHNYESSWKLMLSYGFLFVLSVLTVFRIVDWRIAIAAVAVFLAIFDRQVFLRVDYSLLFTFVGFFIFIGNLQNMSEISTFLTSLVGHNVTLISALASQLISNVPAAILLSGFTNNAEALLRGVSIGGMGTLIASLASVISFKFFTRDRREDTMKYLGVFTVWNVVFFCLLYAASLVLYRAV